MTDKTKADKVATEAYVDDAVAGVGGLGSIGANTILGNPTGSTDTPADLGASDVTTESSPASGDYVVGWESGGALRKYDLSALPVSTPTALAVLGYAQPLDTELTALASVTSAAGKVPYFTGSGTASTFDLSSLETAWTYNVLPSDVSASSTSPVSLGLSFTPAASSIYAIEGIILLRASVAATSPRLSFAWPTGYDDGCISIRQPSAVNVESMRHIRAGDETAVQATSITDATYSYSAMVAGVLVAGSSSSGALDIKIQTETGTDTVYAKKGSYIRYKKIA